MNKYLLSECPNTWHESAPARRDVACAECECGEFVSWWGGEYEARCLLPTQHDGYHWDGMSWWDDLREEHNPACEWVEECANDARGYSWHPQRGLLAACNTCRPILYHWGHR